MGQKLNAVSLRLKQRINWNSSFCVQNIKQYVDIKFNIQQITHSLDLIFSGFHIFSNNATTIKNCKNYHVYSKIIQKNTIIQNQNPIDFKTSDRIELLKSENVNTRRLYLNTKTLKYTFSDLFHKKNNRLKKLTNKQHIILVPKILISYITNQLKRNGAMQKHIFLKNLYVGILSFSYQLLKLIQNHIVGFKIICSGKWKKTPSGRKQKLTIKIGKIVNSSLSNIVLYSFGAQKTKFGVCCIKVWVVLRSS